jgi:hypothetical protein
MERYDEGLGFQRQQQPENNRELPEEAKEPEGLNPVGIEEGGVAPVRVDREWLQLRERQSNEVVALFKEWLQQRPNWGYLQG